MKIVAFLQNQYFNDPVRARDVYARNPELREELNARFLFAGCKTGRHLQTAFGADLCSSIIWEEISREIGDRASSSFSPDFAHIDAVMEKHRPSIILVFGALARTALKEWVSMEMYKKQPQPLPVILYGPHPAARHATVHQELWEMKEELTFKQKEIFGVDVNGRYDYSRKHEPIGSASV